MCNALRAAVLLITMGVSGGRAAAEDTVRTFAFDRGKTSGAAHEGLVRGDVDIWVINARAGQRAEIAVRSIENNVSFRIYEPPSRVKRSAGGMDIDGPQLMGVEPAPGLDAGAGRRWRGSLPKSGRYYVVVSGDRGNATYDLSTNIH